MSTLPKSRGRRRAKGSVAEVNSLARTGGLGWDIAEYVMYCHLCGALSELGNTGMWRGCRALAHGFFMFAGRGFRQDKTAQLFLYYPN